MAFVANLSFLRGWLVVFNLLLAVYCVIIGVLVLQRPCFQGREARKMTTGEAVVLDFHFISAVATLIGSGGLYAGHSKLIQINRIVLVLFNVGYLMFGVWELLEVKGCPVIGALTLLVGILAFVFGAAPSVYFGRLLKRQLAVAPEDRFDGVWSSSASPISSSNHVRSSQTERARAVRAGRAANPRTLAAWR